MHEGKLSSQSKMTQSGAHMTNYTQALNYINNLVLKYFSLYCAVVIKSDEHFNTMHLNQANLSFVFYKNFCFIHIKKNFITRAFIKYEIFLFCIIKISSKMPKLEIS